MSIEEEFQNICEMSFSDSVEAFTKAMEIETRIHGIINTAKIPPKEVKKFLAQLEGERDAKLFVEIPAMLQKMSIGCFELEDCRPLEYTFVAKNSPVPEMFAEISCGKVCHTSVEAIQGLFTKALKLPCDVEEIECVKDGASACKFHIRLQPFSAFQAIFDAIDANILEALGGGGGSGSGAAGKKAAAKAKLSTKQAVEKLAESLKIEESEIEARLKTMRAYQLIDKDNAVTEIGKAFMKYLKSEADEELKAELEIAQDAQLSSKLDHSMDDVFVGTFKK